MDVLPGYASKAIPSPLTENIVQAACACLVIQKEEPVRQTLRFIRDLLAYGMEMSPTSELGAEEPKKNPPQLQSAVKALVLKYGGEITNRAMTGLMYSFSENCWSDASGVLIDMFRLMPRESAEWVKSTIAGLPAGSISPQERERLIININQ
jgi:transportin-3